MSRSRIRKVAVLPLAIVLAFGVLGVAALRVYGADHGDAPNSSNDAAADINDVFAFLTSDLNRAPMCGTSA